MRIKHSRAPTVSRSVLIAREDLRLDSVDVIHSSTDTYGLREGVRAVAATRLLEDLNPLGLTRTLVPRARSVDVNRGRVDVAQLRRQ